MKALLPLVAGGLTLVAAAALQAPTSALQDDPSLEPRVAALEQELKTLQEENVQLRTLLDSTVGYLQAQARASESMLSVLDESETQGFTKGINFKSRETLLSGFRSFWKGVGQGLPKSTETKAEAAPGATARGRRR